LIIAYGGGLTLSLYPIENPIEVLEDSLKDNPRYVTENENDFILVSLTAKYVDDFVKLWYERLRGWEIDLFGEILRNISFKAQLDKNGYFDAIISIEPEIEREIHDKIFSNPRIKKGFSDELKSHFKDLYESIYKKIHKHTYIRYYEIFCHLIIIESHFDLDIAKENVYNHYNQKLMNNILKPTMANMDNFENQIQNQNFLNYFCYDILHFIRYYSYISERIIFLRRHIWAMNYIKTCLNPSHNPIGKKDLFLKDLEGSVGLLNSRKEVIESIKHSIGYHMSFTSTLLGFFGVLITIAWSDPYQNSISILIIIVILFILLISLLYVMFTSIKSECGKAENV